MADSFVYESLFDQLPRHLACAVNPLISDVNADCTMKNVGEAGGKVAALARELGACAETFHCSYVVLSTMAAAMRYEVEAVLDDALCERSETPYCGGIG